MIFFNSFINKILKKNWEGLNNYDKWYMVADLFFGGVSILNNKRGNVRCNRLYDKKRREKKKYNNGQMYWICIIIL